MSALRIDLRRHSEEEAAKARAILDRARGFPVMTVSEARADARSRSYARGERRRYVVREADDTISVISYGSRIAKRREWVFWKPQRRNLKKPLATC